MADPHTDPRRDTICAPATAPGEGAVGIVRVSGARAVAIAGQVFTASSGRPLAEAASHTVHHGRVRDPQGAVLDEVLALVMRAPRSYTAEDVVEIQCHGGPAAVRAILERLLHAGCRMAEPGEFTRRAFVNGRIDLTRAEAVLQVIQARTEAAGRAAQRQMGGALMDHLQAVTEALRDLAAHEEAAIDFPEEDLEADLPPGALKRLTGTRDGLAEAVRRGRTGHLLTEGVRLAIVGRPNVGKSSLLNRLLGYDRAIVTDTPGTTRDVLEADLAVDGVRFVLQDTAGIRATGDRVEAEGVARSHRAAQGADVVLLVVDGAAGVTAEDEAILAGLDRARLVVAVNKSDLGQLPVPWPGPQPIPVSALRGDGVDALREALVRQAVGADAAPLEHAFLLTTRQQHALETALEATERALQGIVSGDYAELVASDLRDALDAVGTVTGETTTDDLLTRIFEQFCIGK
ncbi:MAG: tRNA uridine-5-carboxymethylaminomethyl(34) synthesis GTPase MnmE [Nitrospirota bacterium]|nr:tRNA uridine-5-carboxymethylaminomethyl(34) synthesis GTPase MnmE [Nitrospirota bacterium]